MLVNPIDSAMSTLVCYLEEKICGLTVIDEWPYANQQLEYPSVTITSGNPKRTPLMPYDSSIDEPVDGMVTANEIVAEWDDTFQLDLWCRDKLQRKEVSAQIVTLFDSQDLLGTQVDGLSLEMKDQQGEIARYDIDTIQTIDEESAVERQERRLKISVLVNCREIRCRTYYAMTTIQVKTQVTEDNVDFTDDLNETN